MSTTHNASGACTCIRCFHDANPEIAVADVPAIHPFNANRYNLRGHGTIVLATGSTVTPPQSPFDFPQTRFDPITGSLCWMTRGYPQRFMEITGLTTWDEENRALLHQRDHPQAESLVEAQQSNFAAKRTERA
ncbi:hypothetical protein TI39_contig336g00016 [Zymoseptoria brevis]|uniref:Uncharacterized protein n=1 Tax=Zymoseptoria brevis TaxID=1047168 RepID=A0A0F4GS83_9PEZI|nr:hypothetical protein TI39_contig336g00016 [Zymoseptoria brevis]